jgi:hypothetical protein
MKPEAIAGLPEGNKRVMADARIDLPKTEPALTVGLLEERMQVSESVAYLTIRLERLLSVSSNSEVITQLSILLKNFRKTPLENRFTEQVRSAAVEETMRLLINNKKRVAI